MENTNAKWQVPVRERLLAGKSDWVHPLTKAHCFVNNVSLCGRYMQATDFYETDVANTDILTHPETACKSCYRKWIKKYITKTMNI